jgi:hypothetical protein
MEMEVTKATNGKEWLDTPGVRAIMLGRGASMVHSDIRCPSCGVAILSGRILSRGFTHAKTEGEPRFRCPFCSEPFNPTFTVGYGINAPTYDWMCECEARRRWDVFWHEMIKKRAFWENPVTILPALLLDAPDLAWNMIHGLRSARHTIVDAMINGLEVRCICCWHQIKNFEGQLRGAWRDLKTGIHHVPRAAQADLAELLGARKGHRSTKNAEAILARLKAIVRQRQASVGTSPWALDKKRPRATSAPPWYRQRPYWRGL